MAKKLPAFDVIFTVTSFRNLLRPGLRQPILTGFTMAMPRQNRKQCYLHRAGGTRVPLIRVRVPGVTLRFSVVGPKRASYLVAGVTFAERGGGNSLVAVPCETGMAWPPDSPFGALRLENGALQFVDALPGAVVPQSFTRYKFSLLIQRISDGAVGLIDPEVENENYL